MLPMRPCAQGMVVVVTAPALAVTVTVAAAPPTAVAVPTGTSQAPAALLSTNVVEVATAVVTLPTSRKSAPPLARLPTRSTRCSPQECSNHFCNHAKHKGGHWGCPYNRNSPFYDPKKPNGN